MQLTYNLKITLPFLRNSIRMYMIKNKIKVRIFYLY
jgi:hypothetical protein